MIEENNDIIKGSNGQKNELKDLAEETVINPEGATVDTQVTEEFNWENFENEQAYSEDEKKKLEDLYLETLASLNSSDIIEGVVLKKTDKDVIIDISGKSEGVISSNEFRYNPDLKEGDKVDVVIDKQEDKTGQLVLSHKKAR